MAGDQKAVELALQAQPEAAAAPEQIDLLEELGLEKNDKVVALRNGAGPIMGRPPGARNRRTVEMASYLLSRYTSPLEILAQIGATPTADLAAALGCTLHEALQERRLAALALAPYVHQKLPIAVDVTNRREIHLTIVEGLPPQGETEASGGFGVVDLVARDVTGE